MQPNGQTGMIVGPGPYQRQSPISEVLQPLAHAGILVVLFMFIWLPAAYVVAVLSDWLFPPVVIGVGLAFLFQITVNQSRITVGTRETDKGKRLAGVLLLLIGIFVFRQRITGAWGFTFAEADRRLWIGTPWAGFSVPALWQVLRWGVVIGLPLCLIPTAISLCRRFIMEIEAPSLANSIRALSGRLTGNRWLTYPNQPEAQAENEGPPPPPAFM